MSADLDRALTVLVQLPRCKARDRLSSAIRTGDGLLSATAAAEIALKYSDDEPRDDHGRWTGSGGGGDSVTTAAGTSVPVIGADQARGNSRAVSLKEFQQLASEGEQQLVDRAANASPATGLDSNWDQVKSDSYVAAQASWGGTTVDAHTGQAISTDQAAYALTIRDPGMSDVVLPESASASDFNAAMDQARQTFGPVLERAGSALGVFHDDQNRTVEISPTLVVHSLGEVERIGAFTHAVGGAYNFADGNGYWPPHVK
jgi:hypothetical protein